MRHFLLIIIVVPAGRNHLGGFHRHDYKKEIKLMSKTYQIIIKDKRDNKVVWTESFNDQMDVFKNFIQLQKHTFNPDYFDYEIKNFTP